MLIILTHTHVILKKADFLTESKLELKLQESSVPWFRSEMQIHNISSYYVFKFVTVQSLLY